MSAAATLAIDSLAGDSNLTPGCVLVGNAKAVVGRRDGAGVVQLR